MRKGFNKLSELIIGCAIEVHKELGPGLLESTYQQCLAYELSLKNIPFELEKSLPVHYKEIQLNCGYRLDLLVDKRIILELKSVESLNTVHEAQLLTYMKLSGVSQGYLMNFNVRKFTDGLKAFIL